MSDVPFLLRLINGNAGKGTMLPRSEFEVAESIRDFTVACVDGTPAGCGALHFYAPTIAEIRSLAVEPEWQKQGLGKFIVQTLEAEARSFNLDAVFAFTYIPGFFRKLEFHEVNRDKLPLKAWKDCLRCPKFQCCDEIAVIKHFRVSTGAGYPSASGGVYADENGFVPLPIRADANKAG